MKVNGKTPIYAGESNYLLISVMYMLCMRYAFSQLTFVNIRRTNYRVASQPVVLASANRDTALDGCSRTENGKGMSI